MLVRGRPILVLLGGLLCSACVFDPRQSVDRIALVDFGTNQVRFETLGYYSAQDALQYLNAAGPRSPVSVRCGFFLYRATYPMRHPDGRLVQVSGLMALPDVETPRGLVSYHHGTTPDRRQAPSKPTALEGMGSSSLFAGNGYILVAADYLGLGTSTEVPTYMHTASTVDAVLGLVGLGAQALKGLSKGTVTKLFLVGFSQGGTVTAGVQRELERTHTFGLTLKGVAAIAGAYNLRGLEWKFAIENSNFGYMGYLANSYAVVYGQPLSSILLPPWDERIPRLFDGSRESSFIATNLPRDPEAFFRPEVFTSLRTGTPHWFTAALESNETYRWAPRAPLRLYYGDADKNVSPEESKQAAPYMRGLGGNAVSIGLGAYDHLGTALAALPYVQEWFDSL